MAQRSTAEYLVTEELIALMRLTLEYLYSDIVYDLLSLCNKVRKEASLVIFYPSSLICHICSNIVYYKKGL